MKSYPDQKSIIFFSLALLRLTAIQTGECRVLLSEIESQVTAVPVRDHKWTHSTIRSETAVENGDFHRSVLKTSQTGSMHRSEKERERASVSERMCVCVSSNNC